MKFIVILLIGVSWGISQPCVRMNQLGYLPKETKTAFVFSHDDLANNEFSIFDRVSGRHMMSGPLWLLERSCDHFKYAYQLNFTALRTSGSYVLIVGEGDSTFFRIGSDVYSKILLHPLHYIYTQRCGNNAEYNRVCHQLDANAIDGPDAGKHLDLIGGYHESEGYVRFLGTTSYMVGVLLMSYKDFPGIWSDARDLQGNPQPNNVPDILDEAQWGLNWMLKLASEPGKLYLQIGDDRSFASAAEPDLDSTDYGWGRGRERPVYYATGKPQGRLAIKNNSTGLSNIAGRTAAVFALASWTWRRERFNNEYANRLLARAFELYDMGKSNIGASESVSYQKGERYQEKTFYDDLEWAAVELFRATGKKEFLEEAVAYSQKASDESWMGADTTKYYEYFPFVNFAHYELYSFVDADVKKQLRDYYRRDLLRVLKKAGENVFNYGVPLLQGSNNFASGLLIQTLLYKEMGGSVVFDDLSRDTRDWLFGKNPWGKNFVVCIPESGQYPLSPHSNISLTQKMTLIGALVSGPVRGAIYSSLSGDQLKELSETEQHLTGFGVYQDNIHDGITNEPTLDGTASLVYILGYYSQMDKADRDKDRLSDDDELQKYHTNPSVADTDGDGLTDGDEVLIYKTDPLKADTDGDGIADGQEIINRTNPLDPNDPKKVPPKAIEVSKVAETPKAEPLKAEVGKAIVLGGIIFKTAKATIEKDASEMLARAFSTLHENKEIEVDIYGYTDNVGNERTNVQLSQSRANAVKAWLVERGISPDRIQAYGSGSKNPIADNKTSMGRAKNRRIEFVRTK